MASKLLQILTLSACLTAQVHGAFAMPGVRRALQTMTSVSVPIIDAGVPGAESA